jgi:hypothetical protein
MGTIHASGPAAALTRPELAPIGIGALAVGLCGLFRAADGLGQPHYVAIHESTQHFGLQFAPVRGSLRAVASWAQRFGGVLVSEKTRDHSEQECTYAGTTFDYNGIEVTAYAYVPVTATGT